MKNTDILIVGSGIIGLTIAKELLKQNSNLSVTILEKESQVGMHASGKNSGVLHTGIYYPHETLKAKLCKAGADEMFDFAQKNGIDVRRDGKVIVATSEENAKGIDRLLENANANKISAVKINREEISELEPHANGNFGGIYCKDTAVINSGKVLEVIRDQLVAAGVVLEFNANVIEIDDVNKRVFTKKEKYEYKVLINAAGAFADKIAKLANVGHQYQLVPFKGLYYKLTPEAAVRVKASIYPVPNPDLPFLGIHFTRVINNDVYIGPTAIPAFGRENYSYLKGASIGESLSIGYQLLNLYSSNAQNFRNLVWQELPHLTKRGFISSASKLVDELRPEWIVPTAKVGIRPQLINTKKGKLEMDFLVEKGLNSIHILNAISPAFTSSFAFAKLVVSELSSFNI